MSSSVPFINKTTNAQARKDLTTQASNTNSFDITPKETYINFVGKALTGGSTTPLDPSIADMDRKQMQKLVSMGSKGFYTDSYAIDKNQSLSEIVGKLNRTVNLPNTLDSTDTAKKSFVKTVNSYNRFKLPNPNLAFQKAFPHIFFVRPSCNILEFSNGAKRITEKLKDNPLFLYSWQKCPELVKEIDIDNGMQHDFMMSLSNRAGSFSLSDETIETDTYGKTFTGYKIAYGKNNIASKTAGTFDITYTDDRDLNVYQIHRLWVEYINGVYRGEIAPKTESIFNKILDYTSAVYYILTAEDGETILFWSKYYGVFPNNIPSTQLSWGQGNVVTPESFTVNYNYSFKEDYNPYSIVEFNTNSNISTLGTRYVPIYDNELGHSGSAWVGSPFIEIEHNGPTNQYTYKLRFRPDK